MKAEKEDKRLKRWMKETAFHDELKRIRDNDWLSKLPLEQRRDLLLAYAVALGLENEI